MEKTYITQAQAKQRMGRTGRTGAGTCYHLYTQDTFERKMEKFPAPSIVSDDISFEMMRLLGIETIDSVGELKKVLKQFIDPYKLLLMTYDGSEFNPAITDGSADASIRKSKEPTELISSMFLISPWMKSIPSFWNSIMFNSDPRLFKLSNATIE